jgi:hypothetical protein
MWMKFELWARLKSLKRKFQIWLFRDFTWTRENSIFSPVVHRDARPPGARKSTSLTIFCWFKNFLTKFFLNFVHGQRICGPRSASTNFLPAQITSQRVQLVIYRVNLREKLGFHCYSEG